MKLKLNFNMKLALAALLLGIIAIFVGDPYNKSEASFDPKEMAIALEEKSDLVDVRTLADWIIEGRADFTLVDIRDEEQFGKYHIPISLNLSIVRLQDEELPRNEKIVLYSDDDARTAQAWMLLKSKDYKSVYRLDGGLKYWKKEILFPELAMNATADEIKEFEKMKEISKFFGGTPKIGGQAVKDDEQVAMPKPVMPAATIVRKKPKLKKEGC